MKTIAPVSPAVSRRQFLRRSAALAAAGLSMPTLIPARAFGANGRLGIGFIGIGRQASGLLAELLRQKDAQFVAVADVNLPRAQAAGTKHNAEACQDYRHLLERKDVDGVVTATPEHWRSNICIHACQAGKDIYAEKPMTLTIREGRLMVEAARKYKRVFTVGSQQRSDWIDINACEFLRGGGLGKIKKVYCWNYPSPWNAAMPAQPIPQGLDWDMWCGPSEAVPYNQHFYIPRPTKELVGPGWLSLRPYSGGEMTGWGAHGFDMVQYALGMDDSGPIEIWTEGPKVETPTYAGPESQDRGNKACSTSKVFFRYAGDIVMELVDKTPDGVKPPSFGGIFIGEKGTFTVDRGRISSDPEDLAIDIMKKRPRGYNSSHIANWLAAMKSRAKPSADVEIGHRSGSVCHLGNIARWTGRKLTWDPVKEVFPNDPEANTHLDRPRRKQWELPKTV